jgi:hypothetical protein
VLCTQLAPLACQTCFPSEKTTPPTSQHSLTHSHTPFSASSASAESQTAPDNLWEMESQAAMFTPPIMDSTLAMDSNVPRNALRVFTTGPSKSPQSPGAFTPSSFNPYFSGREERKAGAYARRLSFGSDVEGNDSCNSCNFLVPKPVLEKLEEEAEDMVESAKQRSREVEAPVLRTTTSVVAYSLPRAKHYTSAFGRRGVDEDEESEGEEDGRLGTSPISQTSSTKSSSSQSNSGSSSRHHPHHTPRQNPEPSGAAKTHNHALTYVTRRNPESQNMYSRLRISCIRTLSSESLPRGSASGVITFGDPIAGFTIARIFRLPDPRARGRRRTYALTALGKYEWRVMEAFVQVTKAFERIAERIIGMADEVLEREAREQLSAGRISPLFVRSPLTPPRGMADRLAKLELQDGRRASSASQRISKSATTSPTLPQSSFPFQTMPKLAPPPLLLPTLHSNNIRHTRHSSINTPTTPNFNDLPISSFLSAKKVDPDGFPRTSNSREAMLPKGLNEIVGDEAFFVELHASFCVILHSLVMGLR